MAQKNAIDRRSCLKIMGSATLVPGLERIGVQQILEDPAPGYTGAEPDEEIASLCDLCFWRCGIKAQVRKGRIIRVRGNPDHPRSRGRLCARGNAGRHQVEDPNRLTVPLRRVGPRGEGRLEPISWDDAMDLWAEKTGQTMKAHGPGSIGVFSHGLSSRFFNALMLHLGNPNRTAPSFGQCRGSRDIGFQLTFGHGPGSPERHDMARSRMIVLLGCHIGENVQTGQVAEFADALDNGAGLVVVDPRMSVAASKANRWLPIRPGTDTALLLTWIHLLLEWKEHDKDYIRTYASGLEELERSVSGYTPEWAAEVTQIPRDDIVAVARYMARCKPGVLIHCGRSGAWYGHDTQRARAAAILTALLGAWGRPGGYYLPSTIQLGPWACPEAHGEMDQSVATGGHAFTRFGVAGQEIVDASLGTDARIRQWVLYGANPLQSFPNPRKTEAAMKALDFITMVDVIPSDCAIWADLVLPEAMYLERWDDILAVGDHPRPFVALRQPVVPPRGEARGPYWIAQQLAHRLGRTDCFTHPDVTGYLADRLAPLGISLEELARTGIHLLDKQKPYLAPGEPHRFPTPDGRIKLVSKTMEQHGYDPIPRFEATEQPPAGWFRLVCGRSPYHSFARTQNIRRLANKKGENVLWVNDEVAAAKGLRSGDLVRMQNLEGVRTGPIRILSTPGIRSDVVFTEHGFGTRSRLLETAFGRGVSDNDLLSRFKADGPTGSTGFRINFIQLVTEGGVVLRGETALCAQERAPLPPTPTPPTAPCPEPAPHEEECEPPSGTFDDFLKGNIEDSC